jgi:hypothetical protein
MAHRVKRLLFSEIGPKKKPLPRELEFLKGFPFYAIAEHKINGRLQRRIEFLPNGLQRLIKFAIPKKLENQKRKLAIENMKLEEQLKNLKLEYNLKYKNLQDEYNKEIKQKEMQLYVKPI